MHQVFRIHHLHTRTTRDQGQPPGDPLRPLHKPFVRPRVADITTLADIAYLPLMRCRQLLAWCVTARQPGWRACVCMDLAPHYIFQCENIHFGSHHGRDLASTGTENERPSAGMRLFLSYGSNEITHSR